MNGAVRAVVRVGIYVGAKVYFIHEVRRDSADIISSPYNCVIMYPAVNVKM